MHGFLGQGVASLIWHRQNRLLGYCPCLLLNLLDNFGAHLGELTIHFILTYHLRLYLVDLIADKSGSYFEHA